MVPNLRKLASRLKSESPPPPPVTPTSHKIQILEKHQKELCDKVIFSQISHHLLNSGYLGRDDAFEICLLPLPQQMRLTHSKLLTLLATPTNRPGQPDLWTILLRSLNGQHSSLVVKLDSDLHKLSKRAPPPRLRKEDIGSPQEFRHLKHIGQPTPSTPNSSYSGKTNPFRRFFSLRSTPSESPVTFLFQGSSLQGPLPLSSEDAELVQTFLKKAGVSDVHLRKAGSRKLILDFIAKNGGMDAIRREILRQEEQDPGQDPEKDGDASQKDSKTEEDSKDSNSLISSL